MECWHVFLAVQIALERGPATTAAVGSTADVRQEQGETAGNFQRTGPSGGSWFSEGADPQRTAGQARAEAAMLAGRRTLLTMEKRMSQLDLVLGRTEITLVVISSASPPISGY